MQSINTKHQHSATYLKYSQEVDNCCTFFDLLSFVLVSFDFSVPLDLLELLSLKLNRRLHNFGVDVIGELLLASGNKPIIIQHSVVEYQKTRTTKTELKTPPTPDAKFFEQ